MAGADEFEVIARLLRPLTGGAPEALNLEDDAAVIAARPGFDLVVTKDTVVSGVHFLDSDPLDLVARKLLRVNLSDLAAKGAAPYGYFLSCAWPDGAGWAEREAFAKGLAADQAEFGLTLFGGDTVVTPGPAVFPATLLGWVRAGGMVKRSGARAGDLVQVSGPIGDGYLGLLAATGQHDADKDYLIDRYRLPRPRLDLSLAGASAALDISDGLAADAAHMARASGVRIELELDAMPLSDAARRWADGRGGEGLAQLASGGDDYQILAAGPAPLPGFTVVGRVEAGSGLSVVCGGAEIVLGRTGWKHGNDP